MWGDSDSEDSDNSWRQRKKKYEIRNIKDNILKIIYENIKYYFKIIAEAEQYQHRESGQYLKQKAKRKKRENV